MQKVGKDVGAFAREIVEGYDFMPLKGKLEECVKKDVQTVQECAAIPDDIPVHGFIYDVKTGRLHPVE